VIVAPTINDNMIERPKDKTKPNNGVTVSNE
jgi:hypothetical protein